MEETPGQLEPEGWWFWLLDYPITKKPEECSQADHALLLECRKTPQEPPKGGTRSWEHSSAVSLLGKEIKLSFPASVRILPLCFNSVPVNKSQVSAAVSPPTKDKLQDIKTARGAQYQKIKQPKQKRAENINRHLSKEVQRAMRHVRWCPTELIIGEMLTKTSIRYDITLMRIAISKKSTNNKRWRGCGGKQTFLHCWWGVNWCSHCWELYEGCLRN